MSAQQEGLLLTPNVLKRLRKIDAYIDAMIMERQGWGDMSDVHDTQASLVKALGTLFAATQLWPDGFEDDALSLGGMMPGGIVFGMIGRYGQPSRAPFAFGPVDWSFHS